MHLGFIFLVVSFRERCVNCLASLNLTNGQYSDHFGQVVAVLAWSPYAGSVSQH